MSFLYISLAGDSALACYRIDAASGSLQYLRNELMPGAPSVQGRHGHLPILYVAMRSTGQLLSFRIDADSGRLKHLNTIDTGLQDPAYLLTDHTHRFLVTPYSVSGRVTVYPIDTDGAAREPVVSVVISNSHAHGITIDSSNRYAFVSHTCPGDAIYQSRLSDGHLFPNETPTVRAGEGLGPSACSFLPK